MQLILPRGSFPRCFHVATSTILFPGYEEVTIFGGGVGPTFGVSIHKIPNLANTTVLTFGKHTRDHNYHNVPMNMHTQWVKYQIGFCHLHENH